MLDTIPLSNGIRPCDLDAGMAYRLTLLIVQERREQTLLVRQWVAQAQWPAAVVALSDAHNEPSAFLSSLREALATHDLVPVRSSFSSPMDGMIDLINALSAAPKEFALALQNYDAIDSTKVHDLLGLLLDYLPPQMHIFVLSTHPPPLSNLARLRVRRQLLQLGGARG
ncbi:MAG: hypothetical protein ACP5HS_01595 [Anaerolineae bacterium]